jgi:predicted enzyme related to lactoylglutathione lyase
MKQATWTPGRFVWWELHTPDIARSAAFYEAVVGWKIRPVEVGALRYDMIHAGDRAIGGMAPLSDVKMDGVPPFWTGYVSSPAVDKAAAAAVDAGGKVLLPPVDVPPIGRFAALQDPQGAALMAFKATSGDPPEEERPGPGHVCWTELYTTDIPAAAAFYEKVFGWKLGPFLGNPDVPVFVRGDRTAGGIMRAPPGVPPNWLNHVCVVSLAEARKQVVARDGRIMLDEMHVPGIGTFSIILDNVGAGISLFEALA